MKKIVLGLMVLFLNINLSAYSYAAAGKEPTIDAKEQIIGALNKDDFDKVMKLFKDNEKNYKYLNDDFTPKLYNGLKTSIQQRDKKQIVKYLELSLAAEIQRRIDGGLQNINTYNVAKVMVIKARKFYKLLTISLEPEVDRKLKTAIDNCIKAIGNPGLFGVGNKPVDVEKYKKNQKIIIDIIKSL